MNGLPHIDFELVNSVSNEFGISLQRKGFPRRSEGDMLNWLIDQTKEKFVIANNAHKTDHRESDKVLSEF